MITKFVTRTAAGLSAAAILTTAVHAVPGFQKDGNCWTDFGVVLCSPAGPAICDHKSNRCEAPRPINAPIEDVKTPEKKTYVRKVEKFNVRRHLSRYHPALR